MEVMDHTKSACMYTHCIFYLHLLNHYVMTRVTVKSAHAPPPLPSFHTHCPQFKHWSSNHSITQPTKLIAVSFIPWSTVLCWNPAVLQVMNKIPQVTEPEGHHHRHNSPPLVPIPSQINSVYVLPPYFFRTHFNIILPSYLGLQSDSLGPILILSYHHI
jgi:hypothetical protein